MITHLTLQQRTNLDGFPKSGELIEITGAHELEASDRAILNLLYQHAHDSGRMGDKDAEWEIPMATLRASRHKGNERIRDSIDRLLRVVVTVPLPPSLPNCPLCDAPTRIIKTHLFDFFDLPTDEAAERVTVRFGLPKRLQPVLAGSNRWGRIKAEVVCAMTSKYAIALYEMVQLRANMDRCIETFPIARFRSLMGVPPGKLTRGNDLMRFCIKIALLEVNGLSDMGVDASVARRNAVTPIEAVTVTWWRKEGDEFQAVIRERNRSKVGRMARLRDTVEAVRLVPLALPGSAD
jgi:hypothetical protein